MVENFQQNKTGFTSISWNLWVLFDVKVVSHLLKHALLLLSVNDTDRLFAIPAIGSFRGVRRQFVRHRKNCSRLHSELSLSRQRHCEFEVFCIIFHRFFAFFAKFWAVFWAVGNPENSAEAPAAEAQRANARGAWALRADDVKYIPEPQLNRSWGPARAVEAKNESQNYQFRTLCDRLST